VKDQPYKNCQNGVQISFVYNSRKKIDLNIFPGLLLIVPRQMVKDKKRTPNSVVFCANNKSDLEVFNGLSLISVLPLSAHYCR